MVLARGSVEACLPPPAFTQRCTWWTVPLQAFEPGFCRACCRNGSHASLEPPQPHAALSFAAPIDPLPPSYFQIPHPFLTSKAVDAAVDTLAAYLPLRPAMGAEEGAALTSALAERALCCGRGPVEAKADAAAAALLTGGGGGGGEFARRGAWLVLAARAGGLANEFFPPASAEPGGGGARKAIVAAAAPKAVSGCVRAMSAAMKGGTGLAGGAEDYRKEVRVVFFFLVCGAKWGDVCMCVCGCSLIPVWRWRALFFPRSFVATTTPCFCCRLRGVWGQ